MSDAIRSLDAGEDAYERGLAHGRVFKDDIAANLKTYLDGFAASGLSAAHALAVLIDLEARVLHVADGPPCQHPFIPFAIG